MWSLLSACFWPACRGLDPHFCMPPPWTDARFDVNQYYFLVSTEGLGLHTHLHKSRCMMSQCQWVTSGPWLQFPRYSIQYSKKIMPVSRDSTALSISSQSLQQAQKFFISAWNLDWKEWNSAKSVLNLHGEQSENCQFDKHSCMPRLFVPVCVPM